MAIGHDGDEMPRPRHSAPLRLGAIDPGQRKRIFLDFWGPTVLISCLTATAISALWLPEPSEWVAGSGTSLVVSLLLWRRCGTLRAEHVDGALAVRNASSRLVAHYPRFGAQQVGSPRPPRSAELIQTSEMYPKRPSPHRIPYQRVDW